MSNYGNSIPAIIKELQILNGSDEEYSNSKYGIIDALIDVRENVKELNNAIDNINSTTPENNQTLSGIGDKILETGEQIVAINTALDEKIGQTTPDDPTLDGIATRIALLPTGGTSLFATAEIIWNNPDDTAEFAQITLNEGTDFNFSGNRNKLSGIIVYYRQAATTSGAYISHLSPIVNAGGRGAADSVIAVINAGVGRRIMQLYNSNRLWHIQFGNFQYYNNNWMTANPYLIPSQIVAVYMN